jgi:hypothetical protein
MILAAVPAYRRADFTFTDAWLSAWSMFFVVGFALIALEGAFFMKAHHIRGALPYVVAFVATGIMAAISSAIVTTDDFQFTLPMRCREEIAGHSLMYWTARMIGAAGLFTCLYGVIGSATWPFIRKYYEDPDYGLQLRIPNGRVIIALQMFRGLVTTIVLFPLVTAFRTHFLSTVAALALLLAATMAIGPLTMAPRWPTLLRMIHAVEISLFAILYSLVLYAMFVTPDIPA